MGYKESFIEHVDELLKTKELPPIEVRNKEVEDLTEEYYETMGKYPPSFLMEKLANYLLADTLRDSNSYKVSQEEFPVLSESQKRRRKREVIAGDDRLDYLKQKRLKNPNTFKVRRNNLDE